MSLTPARSIIKRPTTEASPQAAALLAPLLAPLLALLAVVLAGPGCATAPPGSTSPSNPDADVQPVAVNTPQSGGYGLLYDTLSQQAGVNKLLWIKFEDQRVGDRVRRIASDCRDLRDTLDAWAKADPSVNLDMPELPEAETQARTWIAKHTGTRLLLDGKSHFQPRLLLTQAEASIYLAGLCQHLAQVEPHEDRAKRLRQARDTMLDHRSAIVELLAITAADES